MDQLRRAIGESGMTRYRLSKLTGISQGQLAEVMAGTQGLSLDAFERVTEALGVSAVLVPQDPLGEGR
jgi:transcriptional regulator with XRE-family HTH domain